MGDKLKIIVVSEGAITTIPGITKGPFYNFENVDVIDVINTHNANHKVVVETSKNEFMTLSDNIVAKIVDDYGITDEVILEAIERTAKINKAILKYSDISELSMALVDMMGVDVVEEYDSISKIGAALVSLIGNRDGFKNFNDIYELITDIVETFNNTIAVINTKIEDHFKLDGGDFDGRTEQYVYDGDNVKTVLVRDVDGELISTTTYAYDGDIVLSETTEVGSRTITKTYTYDDLKEKVIGVQTSVAEEVV